MHFPIGSSRLSSSTTVGALGVVLATSTAPAYAADSCGPLERGVVTCEISEGPSSRGVVYTSGGGTIVNLADGLNVAPDAGNWGMAVVANEGAAPARTPGPPNNGVELAV